LRAVLLKNARIIIMSITTRLSQNPSPSTKPLLKTEGRQAVNRTLAQEIKSSGSSQSSVENSASHGKKFTLAYANNSESLLNPPPVRNTLPTAQKNNQKAPEKPKGVVEQIKSTVGTVRDFATSTLKNGLPKTLDSVRPDLAIESGKQLTPDLNAATQMATSLKGPLLARKGANTESDDLLKIRKATHIGGVSGLALGMLATPIISKLTPNRGIALFASGAISGITSSGGLIFGSSAGMQNLPQKQRSHIETSMEQGYGVGIGVGLIGVTAALAMSRQPGQYSRAAKLYAPIAYGAQMAGPVGMYVGFNKALDDIKKGLVPPGPRLPSLEEETINLNSKVTSPSSS
jgi:hypothetical protein